MEWRKSLFDEGLSKNARRWCESAWPVKRGNTPKDFNLYNEENRGKIGIIND